MKSLMSITILFVTVGVASVVTATDRTPEEEAVISYVKLLRQIRGGPRECVAFNSQKIIFYLYTRENPVAYPLKLGNKDIIKKSSFNHKRLTKFLVHGWYQDGLTFAKDFASAYLEMEDLNFISVDWGIYANCSNYCDTARNIIPYVGKVMAEIMTELTEIGSKIKSMHLIGHSFGAHVAAFASKSLTGEKPARITGLDPAGPYFNKMNASLRLDKSDADFVDSIHTCVYIMGTYVTDGHANFYPNGGRIQQFSCNANDFICYHQMSVKYFTESILRPKAFRSSPSTSYSKYLSLDYCPENQEIQYMGAYVSNSARGYYYAVIKL